MGYEIQFKFYKKKSEGFGYDTDGEPEILKVSVGKQWDDVELDEVAKACFGQMAKRNILIVDADVFEYTKKKVSFKLKDDGISIKNRKFSYDITGAINSSSEEDQQQQLAIQQGLQPHEIGRQMVAQPSPMQNISHLPPEVQAELRQTQLVPQRAVNPGDRLKPILPRPGHPLRWEIYDPHPDFKAAAKKLPFTLGKRYPIFEEKPDKRGVYYGMLYVTEDDQGVRRVLNDKHFIPVQNLTGDFTSDPTPNYIPQVAVQESGTVINGKAMNLPDIVTFGNRRR